MSASGSSSAADSFYLRSGFSWDAADVYLFDIDGTLVNCRDLVHFNAFHQAFREVLGMEARLDGLLLHGNTDIGIVRGALLREGLVPESIDACMPEVVQRMCSVVLSNRNQLRPELCPSIRGLIAYLGARRRILGAASGNLEPIGWMKLEMAGLRPAFSFGSFAWPRESRAEIFRHAIELAEEFMGRAATVCVIGDTPADIEAARACGVPVIAMATGIYDFAALRACGPDGCCASAADLLDGKKSQASPSTLVL